MTGIHWFDEIHDNLERLFYILLARTVLMVEAYFDESGTHEGSPVMCVAGYLFDSDQALHLDREWAEALERFGIGTFHVVDCAHGTGEFSALSRKERSDLYARLIGIIKRRMTIGIAVSMSDSDFGKIPPPVYERGGPYLFCALQVLAGVIGWAEKHSFPGKISYFFESGHKHQALVHQAIAIMQSAPSVSATCTEPSMFYGAT